MTMPTPPVGLLGLATLLLAGALSGEGPLRAALVAGLQVERVLLDVIDGVILLELSREAAQCALNRLALLDFDFSQTV